MFLNKIMNQLFLIKDEIKYPVGLKDREFAIIYPTDGYYLSKEQYLVLKKVLDEEKLIDDVINIDIEFLGDNVDTNLLNIREMQGFNYLYYKERKLLFENSILDSKFRWSVSIYQDYWGIIYGSPKMIYKISGIYDLQKDLKMFREELLADIRNERTKADFEQFVKQSYNYKLS